MTIKEIVPIAGMLLALPGLCALGQTADRPAPGSALERAERWVAVVNGGDFARMRDFYDDGATEDFRKRRTEDEDRKMFERLVDDLGPLEIVTIERSSPEAVRIKARSKRTPMPVQFDFRIKDELIDDLSVRVGEPAAGAEAED